VVHFLGSFFPVLARIRKPGLQQVRCIAVDPILSHTPNGDPETRMWESQRNRHALSAALLPLDLPKYPPETATAYE